MLPFVMALRNFSPQLQPTPPGSPFFRRFSCATPSSPTPSPLFPLPISFIPFPIKTLHTLLNHGAALSLFLSYTYALFSSQRRVSPFPIPKTPNSSHFPCSGRLPRRAALPLFFHPQALAKQHSIHIPCRGRLSFAPTRSGRRAALPLFFGRQPLRNQHLQARSVSVDSKPLGAPRFHPQLSQNQHLRTPLPSVAFKELITPLHATLTQNTPPNPFRSNTYKKHGGRGLTETLADMAANQNSAHVLLVSHCGDTPCADA
jgi:hypothetical protein